jgi:hypothetical protein
MEQTWAEVDLCACDSTLTLTVQYIGRNIRLELAKFYVRKAIFFFLLFFANLFFALNAYNDDFSTK